MNAMPIPNFFNPYLANPQLNIADLASRSFGNLLKFSSGVCMLPAAAPDTVYVQAHRFATALADKYRFAARLAVRAEQSSSEQTLADFMHQHFIPSFRGAAQVFFTTNLIGLAQTEHPALVAAKQRVSDSFLAQALRAGLLEEAALQVFFQGVLSDRTYIEDVASGTIVLGEGHADLLARMRQLLQVAPAKLRQLGANNDTTAKPLEVSAEAGRA